MADRSNRLAPNYFISIPLSRPHHAELGQRAQALTNRIPKLPGLRIIPPSRLHLTLGVCALSGTHQIGHALSILASCGPRLTQILAGRQLWVQFNEIGTFPPAATRARVVYAAPCDVDQTPNLLKGVTGYVHSRFAEAGLLVDLRPLQLHCTLAKIDHRMGRAQRSMDAQVLFDPACRSAHSLGSYQLNRIELCEMSTTNAEGDYRCEGGLDLV